MEKEQDNDVKFPKTILGGSHTANWNFGDIDRENHEYEEKKNYTPLQYKNMDLRSDKNSDVWFYTCDGKKVSTMEDVMQYNDYFYKKMMNNNSEKNGMNR